MNTRRETALLQEIETLRQELKAYQAREAEWERADQERQPARTVWVDDTAECTHAELELQQRADEMTALREMMLELTSQHDLSTLLYLIVERAAHMLDADSGGMYLCDLGRREVTCVVSYNTPGDYTGTVLKYGEGAAGVVAQTGEALVIDDYRLWPGRAKVFEAEQPFSAVLAAPMVWHKQILGVIHVLHSQAGRRFTSRERELLTLFANQAAVAVQNARLFEDAQKEITVRKQAEEALRESEEKYRAVVEIQTELICRFLPGGTLTFVNDAYCHYFDKEKADLIGHAFLPLIPEEDHQKISQMQALISKETPEVTHEHRVIMPDGQIRWQQWSNHGIFDVEGQLLEFQAVGRDITGRKRVEQALCQSENELRALFAAMTDVVIVYDADGRYIKIAPTNPINLYRPADDMLGKTVHDILPKEQAGYIVAKIGEAIQTGRVVTGEYALQIDDKEIWFACSVSPLSENTAILVAHDITERKQAEEALLESNELLSMFIKHSPIYAYIKWVTPTESRVLKASENYLDMIGVSGSEMVGKTMEDLFPVEFAAKITADDWAVVSHGEVLKLDEDLNDRNYTTIKFPIYQGGKNLLAGYTIDITERKRTEDALRESEERFRALIEHSHDAIALLAADGTVLYDSPSIVRVLGYDPTERLGRSVFEFVHPEERQNMASGFTRFAQKAGDVALSEVRFLHKDGTPRQIEGVRTNLLTEPAVRAVVINYRDITERKQAEQKIASALQEKEILLRELYHRTKNNMQVILSMLSLAAARSRNEELKATYKDIANRIQAMALVHQKLYQSQDLSRINLQDYLQELARLILQNNRISSQKIALRFDIEPIEVLIDTAMPFGLVVTELISNSLKHAFPGEMSGEISLCLARTGQEIELHYSDNGVGVPPDFDFRQQKTYGLQSIFALIEHQLQGKVNFEADHGLTCYICFSDTLYAPRAAA